jgi:hypothetical protein
MAAGSAGLEVLELFSVYSIQYFFDPSLDALVANEIDIVLFFFF